jgi:hypothetical protein
METVPYIVKNTLIPWRRAILDKLIVVQPVKKRLVFYGTQSFIIMFIKARHRPLT